MKRSFQWVAALVLSMAAFFLFEKGFAPRPNGNSYPVFMTTSQSKNYPVHMDEVPPAWNSRHFACVLSSAWFDFWKPDKYNWQSGRICFAAYHAAWVLLLFSLLATVFKNAWLPMVGTIAGLICNSLPVWPPLFLPWDMPAMFFFTAAYLCYRQKLWLLLIATVFIGGFIKETVLVTGLFLLGAPWKWQWRAAVIICVPISTTFINKLFLPAQVAPAWYYSISEWTSKFTLDRFLDVWPVVFANAGGLMVLIFCLVHLRDWPLRIVVAVFIAGQCLNNIGYGVYNEFRVWCELLPIGWILLGDLFSKESNSINELQPVNLERSF